MIRSGIEGLMEFGIHKHSLVGNLKNVFAAFSFILVWTMIITVVLAKVAGAGTNEICALLMAKMSVYSAMMPASMQVSPFMIFFLSCIFAPIWEELAYRYVPLGIAKSLDILLIRGFSHKVRRERGVEYDHERAHLYGSLKGTGFILFAMLGSSVVFGLAHGSVMNIMFQGAGGMVFAWLMIKGGYWPAVMAHAMWNFMLMFGMPIVIR